MCDPDNSDFSDNYVRMIISNNLFVLKLTSSSQWEKFAQVTIKERIIIEIIGIPP